MGTLAATTASLRKRGQKLSADGQWRSFSNVPNLLQYVGSGNYYGRIKVCGKVIRESLETQVWTTAKLRLADFLKRQHEARAVIPTPTYREAATHFKAALNSDNTIKPGTREYRLLCLDKIDSTWPALANLRIANITEKACRDWAVEQDENLRKIQDSCVGTRVSVEYSYETSETFHARSITTDTGWKISLDRGLDIYQRYEINPFVLAASAQDERLPKAFEVTYIRAGEVQTQ